MQTITIDFHVPQGWHELSDKQLRYVYQLLADDFATDEIKTLCLLRWSGTKVIGRQDSGAYLLRKGKILFEVTPLTLAEILPALDWLGSLPTSPVRLSKINRQHALPADFSEVPFETFIICDNLYQGYLQTQNDEQLDQLGATLYGKSMAFKHTSVSASSSGSPRSKIPSRANSRTSFSQSAPRPTATCSARPRPLSRTR